LYRPHVDWIKFIHIVLTIHKMSHHEFTSNDCEILIVLLNMLIDFYFFVYFIFPHLLYQNFQPFLHHRFGLSLVPSFYVYLYLNKNKWYFYLVVYKQCQSLLTLPNDEKWSVALTLIFPQLLDREEAQLLIN